MAHEPKRLRRIVNEARSIAERRPSLSPSQQLEAGDAAERRARWSFYFPALAAAQIWKADVAPDGTITPRYL